MPNTLHFLKPCIGLIPQNVNILFILNGTRICEENYLRDNYKDIPIFKLKTLPYSNFSHGRVLNLLIANNKSNFGIIDHDLYIFNKMIFNKMIFNDDEFVIGAFKITNKKSMLTFPTTHFMFFNVNLIKKIMLKYKIGAQKYRKIPSHLKNKLTTLNFGYHNFLKGYLNYFDTFNLVMAMAFYEKLSAKILKLNYFEDIFHIGGISHGSDNLYRTYINLKLLEIKENQLLREMYCDCFLEYGSSKDIVKLLPKQIHTFNYMRQIDSFTEKLEQYLYK